MLLFIDDTLCDIFSNRKNIIVTLVICTTYNSRDSEISAFADSRISHAIQGKDRKITDFGAKLFIVPIVVYRNVDGKYVEAARHSVGLAFAGSTLLANNVYALGSSCCQVFCGTESDKVPSVEGIANVFRRIIEEQTLEINQSTAIGKHITCQCLVFGFCRSEREPVVCSLESLVDQDGFSVVTSKLVMRPGLVTSIGSGATEFNRICADLIERKRRFELLDVFSDVAFKSGREDVGGSLQVLIADENGARIQPVMHFDDTSERVAIKLLGLDLNKFTDIDGFSLGFEAIAPDSGRHVQRKALRKRGYDPDDPSLTRAFKNKVAMENLVEYAATVADCHTVRLTQKTTVEPPDPILGEHYIFAQCRQCHNLTPLIFDPSKGAGEFNFEGDGNLQSNCLFCRAPVSVEATKLLRRKWTALAVLKR